MWSCERKDQMQKNTHPPPRKSPSTTMRRLDLQIQCRGLLIVCSILYLSSGIGETTWQHGKWEVNPFSSYPSPSLSFDLTVLPSFVSLLCSWASQVSKRLPGHSISKNQFACKHSRAYQSGIGWKQHEPCTYIALKMTEVIPASYQSHLNLNCGR